MTAPTFVCWKWKSPYENGRSFPSRAVNELRARIRKHYRAPHRFVCITDDTAGLDASIEVRELPATGLGEVRTLLEPVQMGGRLVHYPSCYQRLWIFSEAARELGDLLFQLDVDTLPVGDLVPLVRDFPGDFVGWLRAADGVYRMLPTLAGCAFKLRAGSRPDVFDDFDPASSPATAAAAGYRGSDQAWMSLKLLGPNAARMWTEADGLRKVGTKPPRRSDRLMFTIGLEPPWSPAAHRKYPWLRSHYAPGLMQRVVQLRAARSGASASPPKTVARDPAPSSAAVGARATPAPATVAAATAGTDEPRASPPPAIPDPGDRAVLVYLWPGPRGFSPELVNVLAEQIRQHSPELPVVVVSDGFPLERFDERLRVIPTPAAALGVARTQSPEGHAFPTSYRRLWTFSREAAAVLPRQVLLLDVDAFVLRPLEPYFDRSEDFVAWRPRSRWGAPGRIAGGTWLHKTGTLPHIWTDFAAAPNRAVQQARAAGYRGSDQAWLSLKLRGCAEWPEPHGIYQAQDYGTTNQRWPIPADARILHFNGTRHKPWATNLAWIRDLYAPYLETLRPLIR